MQSEDNLDEIVESIFSKPPGPKRSIQLQLEEYTADLAQKQGVDDFVFNILCLLTFKGMQRLYGHKNLLELTNNEFNTIQKYIESCGYKLQVYGNDTNENPWEITKRGERLYRYNVFFDKVHE